MSDNKSEQEKIDDLWRKLDEKKEEIAGFLKKLDDEAPDKGTLVGALRREGFIIVSSPKDSKKDLESKNEQIEKDADKQSLSSSEDE